MEPNIEQFARLTPRFIAGDRTKVNTSRAQLARSVNCTLLASDCINRPLLNMGRFVSSKSGRTETNRVALLAGLEHLTPP